MANSPLSVLSYCASMWPQLCPRRYRANARQRPSRSIANVCAVPAWRHVAAGTTPAVLLFHDRPQRQNARLQRRSRHRPRADQVALPIPHSYSVASAFGSDATILSNALAGPVGLVRCCSQFCNVRKFTPISLANWLCATSAASRMLRTSGSKFRACARNFRFGSYLCGARS